MRVVVEYAMPVFCEVDTGMGIVVRVWAGDEELSLTERCFDCDGNPLDGSSEEGEATMIAERDEWPVWQ